MSDAALKQKLDRLVELLRVYSEPQWYSHFNDASKLLAAGKLERSKRKIRSAYGGMGSFNDSLYFTGAPKEIADEGFRLRDDLYLLAEPQGLAGFFLRFTP